MNKPFKVLLGLSASVAANGKTFVPLAAQHNIPLLAESRWRGFAAAINHGFAEHLVVLGGLEKLPEKDVPLDVIDELTRKSDMGRYIMVPRGLATVHGLIQSYQVLPQKLSYRVTGGNTGGNIDVISQELSDTGLRPQEVGITTNLYHLPRVIMDLHSAGFPAINMIPTEAFWLATTAKNSTEREVIRHQLQCEFGESPLAQRVVMELNGAADKLLGVYEALSN